MKKYLISLIPGILLFWLFYTTHVGEVNLFLRALGRVSFFYIALALFITPLVTLTSKQKLLKYRRALGVLACYLAIFHALYYFKMEYDFQKTFFILEHFKAADIITGIIGLAIIVVLGVTSNDFSVNKLKAYWWKIQSLTYPLFVVVALHVAFASRFENFYIIVISTLVIARTLAYFKDSKGTKSWGKPRYLCVPCGYIYDEDVGDPDGGIAPGTKWEDIPDDWRCPVCGVGKSDFILIGENTPEEPKVEGTITAMETLTPDVVELQVTSDTQFFVRPWQFATFDLKDDAWVFKRTYSIASYIDGVLTFLIKISKDGRGGKVLKTMKVWDSVCISHIGGTFKLVKNDNKKVFLATGTGLAPIYSMISQLDREGIKTHLYFGIRNLEDVFYEEKLKSFKNLTLRIHCSWLETDENCDLVRGRINIDEFEFPPATDFYICGSPDMLNSSIEKLQAKGYTNIYFEKF